MSLLCTVSKESYLSSVNGELSIKNGRGERIRTSDILLPKQARYQAALRPEGYRL